MFHKFSFINDLSITITKVPHDIHSGRHVMVKLSPREPRKSTAEGVVSRGGWVGRGGTNNPQRQRQRMQARALYTLHG